MVVIEKFVSIIFNNCAYFHLLRRPEATKGRFSSQIEGKTVATVVDSDSLQVISWLMTWKAIHHCRRNRNLSYCSESVSVFEFETDPKQRNLYRSFLPLKASDIYAFDLDFLRKVWKMTRRWKLTAYKCIDGDKSHVIDQIGVFMEEG